MNKKKVLLVLKKLKAHKPKTYDEKRRIRSIIYLLEKKGINFGIKDWNFYPVGVYSKELAKFCKEELK